MSMEEINVRDYASEHPYADYRAIVKRFGSPERIAESCVTEMETEELLRELQIRKKILWVTLIAVVVTATVWSAFTAAAYLDHFADKRGYATIEVIEVERTITDGGK